MRREELDSIKHRAFDALIEQPIRRWPEIWNSLNGYRWHDALGEKPEDWEVMPDHPRTSGRIDHPRTKNVVVSYLNKYIDATR